VKVLFVYPRFDRHADAHPELRTYVPMNEYLGSPSLGIAMLAACTPGDVEIEFRDDRLTPADTDTDADLVALSFFTPAAMRGLELADHFRRLGKRVVAGGIFSTAMPDVVAPHVDAVVVGEGEAVWQRVLADAARGALAPRYEGGGAVLSALPIPRLDLYFGVEDERFRPDDFPVQISRGCPLACDACILPVSMGGRLRTFPLEHVLGQLAQLAARGRRGCLTEDTSWFPGLGGRRLLEAMFDALIERGERASVSYVGISLPMLATVPAPLLAKAKAAGVDMFYLVTGFDPISRRGIGGHEARSYSAGVRAVRRALDHGIEPYASFLVGNEDDDASIADRTLQFARDAGIRKAEFAIATPYPGTPQWRALLAADRILTRDWRRYNDANVVFRPAKLTPDALQQAYLTLWRDFYAGRDDLAALSASERTIQF
jgi:radical SAM superfamily enzyme YgiQ (UPF0313 family)